jgi:glycosyltransferase involved in cell wall biosynthesis
MHSYSIRDLPDRTIDRISGYPSESGTPLITVIVPVYNGEVFIDSCLDAIYSSDYERFEVVVVDDCSTDASAEMARSKGARMLRTPNRSGPAAARNLAAGSSAGEILMFVDADVLIEVDTLSKVASRFVHIPEISALFGSYDDEPAEQNFLSQYKNLQHHFVHQTSSRNASTFWSGLGAVRRDVFLQHGGFDCDKFPEPSIEDIELGFRMRKGGQSILLDKDIQAKHLKKWTPASHLRTEVFCRALPWSKLILEQQGLINDMNLRSSDRISAGLVGISVILLPLVIWFPAILSIVVILLIAVAILNRDILAFYSRKRGFLFAAMTFPWQILYYLYSGIIFAGSWHRYKVQQWFGHRKGEHASGHKA